MHNASDTTATTAEHPLINRYCIANGLVGETKYNGQTCFVVKKADNGGETATATSDGDIRLAVIFTGDDPTTKVNMLLNPDFVSIKAARLTPKYDVVVRPSPLGGLGVFATRAFKAGEVIISNEVPFLEMHESLAGTHPHTTPQSFTAIVKEHAAAPVLEALSSLTVGPKNNAGHARGGDWSLRLANNALEAAIPRDDTSTLYPLMCRINHACSLSPAKNVWWGTCTSRTLTACRDIADGEELLTDYLVTILDPAEKALRLRSYGIPNCASSAPTKTVVESLDGQVNCTSKCTLCADAEFQSILRAFRESCDGIEALTAQCAVLSHLTPQTLAKAKNQFPAWCDNVLQRCKEMNTLFDSEIIRRIDNVLPRNKAAPYVFGEARRSVQLRILQLLFQFAVSYGDRPRAKKLHAMLVKMFNDQGQNELRHYGGNNKNKSYLENAKTCQKNISNANAFLKKC